MYSHAGGRLIRWVIDCTVTNITNHIHEDGPAFLTEHGKNAPIKRAADPREIAEVIVFLASAKASYIVGAVVMADGGMSVALK